MKYHATLTHNGHKFNEYIDDYDWTYSVQYLTNYFKKNGYAAEDFDGEFADSTWETIDDFMWKLITEMAVTDMGYKYGFNSYARRLVSNKLFSYFKQNFK